MCVVIANAVAVVVFVLLICCPTTILVDHRVDSGREKYLKQFFDLHMKFLKMLIKELINLVFIYFKCMIIIIYQVSK